MEHIARHVSKDPLAFGVAASAVSFVGATMFLGTTPALLLAWIAWYSRSPDDPTEFICRARRLPANAENPIPTLPEDPTQITGRVTRWPLFCTGTLEYTSPGTATSGPRHVLLQCLSVFGNWHVL